MHFKINMRFKRWVRKWILSEHLFRKIRLYRYDKLQKFWLGHPPVPAPPFETSYFRKANLDPRVVRRLDDYRSAVVVTGKTELPIEKRNGKSSIQFAISPARDWVPDKLVRFKIGGHETLIREIPVDRWFDVRLDLEDEDKTLIVEPDAPVEITMPRLVKNPILEKNRKEIRHIVVCVLDAWSTATVNEKHPMTGENSLTPNIDRFFSQGLCARKGISSGQWTLPAVGTLFTGLHVSRHKMTHPWRWQEFDRNRRTLPEYFQHAGYHTLCGSVVSRVTPAFGHNRGFDRFLYHFPGFSYQTYDPAVWIQEIIGHMEAHYGDRTFSYFQFPDTHPSWDIAPETRYFHLCRRGNTSSNLKQLMTSKASKIFDIPNQAQQLYSLRLAEIDRMLGCIFDYVERKFEEEALIVVTADHGMRMPYMSEAHQNDEPFLTDIRVNIPLFMRGLGVPVCSYDGLCPPNLDLPLTLLNLAGLKPDLDDFDGTNVLDRISLQKECVISEYVYAGIYELAVRGYGHALFLKFEIDDKAYKILSREPIYIGLYSLNTASYGKDNDLINEKPDVFETLRKVAIDHINNIGLMENIG